ncbi:MAG: aminotransferase class V-fold PLP-dependent enzyme [Myxococcota bacterium]
MDLDVDFARAQFPALQSPWALFDNAGGSVTPRVVADRVHHYMQHHQVQLGASYGLSQSAEAAVRAGEATAATLLGASVAETIVGPSTTANLNTLSLGIGALMNPGDEIIVTNLDHESNIGCWRRMASRGDLVLREWMLRPETASLHLDDLRDLLTDKTRMVAFTHCANVVGAILDVPTIVAAIRENRADTIVGVDGVAYAPHRHVDVKAWDVDLYSVSLYKVYGPHLGCVYGRESLILHAAGQNHEFIPESQIPYKFQPGNVTHELAAGLPGITDYFASIADRHQVPEGDPRARHAAVFDLFSAHEAKLAARLLEGLNAHDAVTVLGPCVPDPDVRVPTVAFTVKGRDASALPPIFDERGVALRYGHFYAKRAIDALGLADRGGIVRVSLVHYNTLDEVDRFLSILGEM